MITDKYVGMPYDPHSFDCADFVILVQKELFGREIYLPSNRPRVGVGQRHMRKMSEQFAERVDQPETGDLVLMREYTHRRDGHVGVYFFLHHEAWVLHCNESDGCSVLHRLRELTDYSIKATGFYRWKTP